MVKKPDVLAVIPARGGSKGIPRKNIRDFAGAPLIAWSIAAALRAETVTRVIVSTDDEEIAGVAREWGAQTPFLRPAELAQDDTTDYPVFRHALDWLAAHEDYHPDVVVQLRPTSPVRPSTWWTTRSGSCSRIPPRTACAGWCLPGRTLSKCGRWTPKADACCRCCGWKAPPSLITPRAKTCPKRIGKQDILMPSAPEQS